MEESILKSDIFFFIATWALVVITLLLAVGLFYVLSILRTIRDISKTAKAGTDAVVEGINEAKDDIKQYGAVPVFGKIFRQLYKKRKK